VSKKIYTIEQTGKRWKGIQAAGCLGSLAGIGMVIAGTTIIRQAGSHAPANIVLSNLSVVGILFVLVGFCVITFGQLGAWWFHG
jgi:hypothetical protein